MDVKQAYLQTENNLGHHMVLSKLSFITSPVTVSRLTLKNPNDLMGSDTKLLIGSIASVLSYLRALVIVFLLNSNNPFFLIFEM